jgi:hypothetical protein
VLSLLAILLGLTAILMLYAAMSSNIGAGAIVAALCCAAGSTAIVWTIKRRRSINF